VTLSDLSIERPVLTWMMMIAVAVFGLLGYQRLGVDMYPEFENPSVTVDATGDSISDLVADPRSAAGVEYGERPYFAGTSVNAAFGESID